ncbi:vacuolar protein sorting-associated protein 4 [Pyricularia oryzae 70-15]|uniref:Vacuolar protein sorting-associated protein 4 n=3 Tax=Pyricularia oryzae TaxID=318829 RepID=G4N1A6_PYRO7|nr:vacuolar protein sorting-associated protein 4 [Pyricularia oryzae 70-15]EHA52377.1 vacuolar protein sorting-associated protein 4 [Pyricularia oryzae 70-15]ELQ38246.1 vacuolar protein sorting-associated protein 4 [Pyricularia oryzae Y34]
MDVDSPFRDLLRTTYDECFSEAQSAVTLEEQDAIAPADQRWRAVVGRIKYLRSLLPQEHAFKHETDKNAMKGLRELELTAQEHLDLHEGLRLSLQSLNINQPVASPNRSTCTEQDDGLAYGEAYQSYPRPPLPPRGTSSPGHSTAAVIDSRSSSDAELIPSHTDMSTLSSTSASKLPPPPAPERKSERPGSPGKHKFRTTLRTGKPGFRPRNAGPTAPGADMAAAAAWTSKDSRTYRDRSPSSEGSPRVAAAGARTQAYLASLSSPSDQYTMRFDRHTRRLVPKEKSRAEERSHSSEAADSAAAAMRSMSESTRVSGSGNGVNDSNTAATAPALARQAARRSGEVAASSRTRRSADGPRPSLATAPAGRDGRSYSGSSRRERRVKEEPITLASNGATAKTHDERMPASTEGEDAEDICEDPSSMTWEAKRAWVLRNIPPGVEGPTAAQILDEIDPTKDVVHWKEIAGLDEAKNALKEAVVYPFLRPDLFKGLREPPRGILLFGPPGTGKTMLARAVATESESTYIAVTASTLNSKYLGESEKHVRALFTVAKMLAPSIIFIDEVDSVLSKRSSSGEHEASRRLKTEFLIQWSSLEKANTTVKQLNGRGSGDNRVLVLAATNRPWDLDDAATRRFARRQYIPLPESETRSVQLQKLLESELKHCLTESDVEELVRLTEGYSGSDITHLARQASYGPLRSHGEAVLQMTSEEIRPIDMSDFVACLRTVRPSVNQSSLKQFEEWARQFGETIG